MLRLFFCLILCCSFTCVRTQDILQLRMQGNTPLVSWSAEDHPASALHILERSADGVHFVAIALKDPGKAPHFEVHDQDLEPTGVLHYRLRYILDNGQELVSASSILRVEAPAIAHRLYPNPAHTHTVLEAPAGALLVVMNAAGQQVGAWTVGSEGSLTLDVQGWPVGCYVCRLTVDNQPVVMRLVKW
ncbi:MAG: T9SS type A sorting domain-containing protein [Bacteroidetes bacterium]|nr:T9SS type A sorting domain-containing protein [Bacteroidota bacterium]